MISSQAREANYTDTLLSASITVAGTENTPKQLTVATNRIVAANN